MLKKIRIQNAWTHKDSTFEFKEGHTTISGKNGTGKSLIAEMSEYAYWGSKALRGEADDYKKVIVNQWFVLRGKDYHILRSAKAVQLNEVLADGKTLVQIASGTTAVNAAVKRLFGYSYEVYRVANSAKQGEIAALSKMLPAARKRLVDETIGLNVIDSLEKFITEKLKAANSSLTLAQENHVPPVAPPPVEGYRPECEIFADLVKERETQTTLRILESQANAVVKHPVEPINSYTQDALEEMRAKQELYVVAKANIQSAEERLKTLPASREPVSLHLEDANYDLYVSGETARKETVSLRNQVQSLLGGTPRSSPYNIERLLEEREKHRLMGRWISRETLRQQLVHHECPKCHHGWHTEDPRLADYEGVPEEKPVLSREFQSTMALDNAIIEYERIGRAQGLFEQLDKHDMVLSLAVDRSATIEAISKAREDVRLYEESKKWDELRETLKVAVSTPLPRDWSLEIKEAEASLKAWNDYCINKVKAQEEESRKAIAAEAVKRFPKDLAEKIQALETLSRAVILFDEQTRQYRKNVESYEAQGVKIAAFEDEVDQWKAARGAMMDVRSEVKGYLLPSLNRVASSLLTQMTGGVLTNLHVDEDFEVRVAGQKINTLSGAGEDGANLALRLGLGTVLTNQVYSSLMLDEVDAGYDDERAIYTSQCLNNLTKVFKQVIVVTHKPNTISDHRIEL